MTDIPTRPPSLCYICITSATPLEEQCTELRINCEKCNQPYGEKHASTIDSKYCQDCLKDFDVTKQDYIRAGVEVSSQTDENGNRVEVRKSYKTTSTQIILFGQDWLFNEIRISQLSLEQLETSIEWHRANVSLMESEITRHKIERSHKLAKVKVPMGDRTKIKTREKQEKKLAQLSESLLNTFKNPEDLAKLIAQLQGGK